MLLPIIGGVVELGKTWLEGKNVKIKAKAEAQATVLVKAAESEATWETVMAQNSSSSWKDEWITILFSIPMILCFFPSTVEHVKDGFTALETMPDWYQYTLSIIVAASFGVRSAIGFMKK
jgi:hypothetical protein